MGVVGIADDLNSVEDVGEGNDVDARDVGENIVLQRTWEREATLRLLLRDPARLAMVLSRFCNSDETYDESTNITLVNKFSMIVLHQYSQSLILLLLHRECRTPAQPS
jgi:hypothetical protein